jgi:hypothetical protein
MNGQKKGWSFVKKILQHNAGLGFNDFLKKITIVVIKGLIWKSGFNNR